MTYLSKSWLAVPFMAAALSLGSATPASAQGPQRVEVRIPNLTVANLIAVDVTIEDVNLLVNAVVQAPIGIAANVCGIAANVLAQDIRQDGEAQCDANTTTMAFSRLVQRQIG